VFEIGFLLDNSSLKINVPGKALDISVKRMLGYLEDEEK
jgi:hypothetical protein